MQTSFFENISPNYHLYPQFGVDEVGRGCLAGCVVAAIVKLDKPADFLLADSKKISAKKREEIATYIQTQYNFAIADASPQEIDEINILQASLLAMQRAIKIYEEKYNETPHHIFVDGRDKIPHFKNCTNIIQGDSLVPSISAASIIAKVYRDALMSEFSNQYPNYGFENHKGYGTKAHLNALDHYGITPLHRTSFTPIKIAINTK